MPAWRLQTARSSLSLGAADAVSLAPLYAQALVGMVSTTATWWLDVREPAKEVVAAHLVNLCWNGLTNLEPSPQLSELSLEIGRDV